MERKTLDKARLVEIIEVFRALWTNKMSVDEACEISEKLVNEGDGYILWVSVREVVCDILWGINREVTNEQVFNIFQILGYDIV